MITQLARVTIIVKDQNEALRARGVKFVRPPAKLPYGAKALFEDLYGNQFRLLQRP